MLINLTFIIVSLLFTPLYLGFYSFFLGFNCHSKRKGIILELDSKTYIIFVYLYSSKRFINDSKYDIIFFIYVYFINTSNFKYYYTIFLMYINTLMPDYYNLDYDYNDK